MPKQKKRNMVVFYDADCIDGGASYWVFQKKYADDPNITIHPVPFPRTTPEKGMELILENISEGDEIFFLDSCPVAENLSVLMTPTEDSQDSDNPKPRIKSVTIWDAHKNAPEKLEGYAEEKIENFKSPTLRLKLAPNTDSSALLVWEQLFQNEKPPQILQWVGLTEPGAEIADEREMSIVAYMKARDIFSPKSAIEAIEALIATDEQEMVEKGEAIREDQANNIEKMMKNMTFTRIQLSVHAAPIWVPVVNAKAENFGHGVGDALIKEGYLETSNGIGAAWQLRGDGTVEMTLRADYQPAADRAAKYFNEKLNADVREHEPDVVIFQNLEEFLRNVPIHTKDEMLDMISNTGLNTAKHQENTSSKNSTKDSAKTQFNQYTRDPSKRNIVLFYDADCIDGAACYWTFSQKYTDDPNVALHPVALPRTTPERSLDIILSNVTEHDEVFFTDTCPTVENLQVLLSPTEDSVDTVKPEPRVKSVTIWDHHKTSAEQLANFTLPATKGNTPPKYVQLIDTDKGAAAHLVWEKLFPNQEPPELFYWVGKAEPPTDLKNDTEKAIVAYIDSKTIRNPYAIRRTFRYLMQADESEMVERGMPIKEDQDNNIEKMLQNVMYAYLKLHPDLPKKWVPVVNASADNFGRSVNAALIREARLGTSNGLAGAWQIRGDGSVKLSLRSRGKPDVAKIAEYLGQEIGAGGGGHPTDAVVHFSDPEQFLQNVRLYTKEQMEDLKWDTEFNKEPENDDAPSCSGEFNTDRADTKKEKTVPANDDTLDADQGCVHRQNKPNPP